MSPALLSLQKHAHKILIFRDFEFRDFEISRFRNIKISLLKLAPPNGIQILEKSTSDALLEHFGHPLGAKMAQERPQEQKIIKNTQS